MKQQQLRVLIWIMCELKTPVHYYAVYCPSPFQAEQLRDEIISSMFRALVSDNPAIYSAARRALERIMKVAKIPKNLLQNSLRPILQNLGDYRRLTLRLLHGLGRLLELLSDWCVGSTGRST